MNKLAYLILSVMKEAEALSKLSSVTAGDIHHEIMDSHYSYSAVYKKLRSLFNAGYIASGIKDGNSNTFYIVRRGLDLLAASDRQEEDDEE